ncbi:hypothetical protein CcrColossus_gp339 [Caulobacter phage CcrColossus]|uniref:Uncharacterized protein n=1 Tax=Caulobacter phage CcrColossus TaxID=1211640 RepID=K4JS80_9CAUD|nr:hypothetical protein CcrColossus_gp339 [Caulobacter phage CcrColossus]AFU88209.1 hypothetical protein CcrColossus_gp339 [Caulobacter phage CcrColossus]
MRGVDVNESYQTEQRSFDGQLAGSKYGASGGPDLTREQWRAMQRAERQRFTGKVMMIFLGLFLLTWVIADLTHFNANLNLPF